MSERKHPLVGDDGDDILAIAVSSAVGALFEMPDYPEMLDFSRYLLKRSRAHKAHIQKLEDEVERLRALLVEAVARMRPFYEDAVLQQRFLAGVGVKP